MGVRFLGVRFWEWGVRFWGWAGRFWGWAGRFFDFSPKPALSDLPGLVSFVHDNSAYVSQVTLYGYVKTRAGTQFPKLFENDLFVQSLKISRWHIFGACVVDLSFFVAGRFFREGYLDEAEAGALADALFSSVLGDVRQDDVEGGVFEDLIVEARARGLGLDFLRSSEGGYVFSSCATALMRWAPVVDEFKALDEEIVLNSLHFRWIGVRRELVERLDCGSVLAGWER